jgi:DNA-binding NarL/FixJ family response regulator
MSPIRVAVVDDQDLVRAGFIALLNAADRMEVVGEAGQGEEALRVIDRTRPDVVLLDIRMPVMNGIDVITRVRANPALSATRIVVLTTFSLDEYVFGALMAGADAFLLKDTPPAELLRGVRIVAEGDALLSPTVTRRLLEEFAARQRWKPATPLPDLTEREADVLALVLQGLSNSQIADRLYIGTATAKTYVSRLLGKFMVESRVALAIAAQQAGFRPD